MRPLFLGAFFRLLFCLGPSIICSFCPPCWCVIFVSQLTVRAWDAGQWVVTGYTVATYLQWIHRIINDLISTFPIVAQLGGGAGCRPAHHHHHRQREAINPEFKSTLLPQLVASCFYTHGNQLHDNMMIQNFYGTPKDRFLSDMSSYTEKWVASHQVKRIFSGQRIWITQL